MEMNAYDEVAIEALDDFVKRSGVGPKAAILHLYGQHFYYEERYPQDTFDAEPSNLNTDELAELRYARAAEYGVKVLLMAAAILDAQDAPAFLVFTSDHGENLPSDKTGKHYHAGPSSGKFDVVVPALVLWNEAFLKSGNSRRLDKLMHANGLISHRDVAKAWLVLEGLDEDLSPTVNPMTWGASHPGVDAAAISCATLDP
jgi:glucan phosphoethanolaminetransferase (alkaline phosphatase superfamily)